MLLGKNLTRLVIKRWGGPITSALEHLSLEASVGAETLRKMARGEGNPDLSKIHAVAVALRTSAADLFKEASSARNAPDSEHPRPAGGELHRRSS